VSVGNRNNFFIYLRGGLETHKVLLILEQNCVQHDAYVHINLLSTFLHKTLRYYYLG